MTVEKIYHVETQEDYDDLMIELEEDGYVWVTGKNPTDVTFNKDLAFIILSGDTISNVSKYYCMTRHLDDLIETYKVHKSAEFNDSIFLHNDKGWVSIVSKGDIATAVVGTAKQIMTLKGLKFNDKQKLQHTVEPEKVLVPQFVADWIEENNNCDDLLRKMIFEIIEEVRLDELSEWFSKNESTFKKAMLYGYEVEKEKLYTVEIESNLGLIRNSFEGTVMLDQRYDEPIGKSWTKELTAQQIKDYDNRFWVGGFAKEVTE